MEGIMRLLGVLLFLASIGFADTITLRDGRSVSGSYLGGDARNVRLAVGDRVDSFRVDEISTIVFGDNGASASGPSRNEERDQHREEAAERRDAERRGAYSGPQIPVGTTLTVRMI